MIRCLKFRPHQKNTLQGFADLELVRNFAADAYEEREAFRKQALAAIHEFTAEEEVS
jgi:hypothetical protein